MNGLRAYVADRDQEIRRKFSFYHEVPGFDVAALQFAGAYTALQRLRRQGVNLDSKRVWHSGVVIASYVRN